MLLYLCLTPPMKKYSFLFVALLSVFIPFQSAQAAEIYSGQTYFLNKDTIAPDNLLIASGRAQIAGLVKGDLIIVSGDVTISGQVDGDIIMAGGTLDIQDKAVIGKNIRAASGDVHVDGQVKGSVQVFAGTFTCSGKIAGNVYADVGTFYLNGSINGSAKVDARNIHLDEKSFVHGDFKYKSLEALRNESTAKVQGLIINLPSQTETPWYQNAYFWGEQLATSISYWLLALLLICLFPNLSARYADTFGKNVLFNFLMGIMSIGSLVLVCILLAVTIIGIPLSLLTIILTGISIWLAPLGLVLWFTKNIAKQNWLEPKRAWLTALVLLASIFVLMVVQAIPLLGPLVHLLTITCGLGALMICKWQVYKESKNTL